MTSVWFVEALAAYSLQIAIVASAAALLWRWGPLRNAHEGLAFWRLALGIALLAPWLFADWVAGVEAMGLSSEVAAFGEPLEPPQSGGIDWPALVTILLPAGLLFRSAWVLIGMLRLRSIRRAGRAPGRLVRESAGELMTKLGVQALVLTSQQVRSPATYGFFHSVVILPADFERFNESARRSMLIHELLHVRRSDWLWMMFEELVQAVFWFHPAIWWLVRRLRVARECAVDREAVEWSRTRQDYIDALLTIAKSASSARPAPVMGFSEKPALEQRIQALVSKERSMSVNRRFLMTTTMATLASFAAWGGALLCPLQAAPQAESAEADVPRIEVERSVQRKKLVKQVRPMYPIPARKERVQGTVKLAALIDPEGAIVNLDVIEGPALLIESAIDAVKQWRYSPTEVEGKRAEVLTQIDVNYTLKK